LVHATTKHAKSISKPKTTKATGVTQKASSSAHYDCDNDHNVVAKDDNTLQGTLHIHSCEANKFISKSGSRTVVGSALSKSLQKQLSKLGLSSRNINITNAAGDSTETTLTYQCPCAKDEQDRVTQALHDACKDQDVKGTIDNENQPDSDERTREDVHYTVHPTSNTKSNHSASKSIFVNTEKTGSHLTPHITDKSTDMFICNVFLFSKRIAMKFNRFFLSRFIVALYLGSSVKHSRHLLSSDS
jgi:hypothetical protein